MHPTREGGAEEAGEGGVESVECLTKEIKEAERKQRELKEVELERLTQEKERLEEKKQVEQQCTATLHGSERVAERR